MSKYVKIEDAMEVHKHFARNGKLAGNIIEEYNNLPTIEVSEDCISREWLEQNFQTVCENVRCNECSFNSDDCRLIEFIIDAPSVVPTTEQSSMVGERKDK